MKESYLKAVVRIERLHRLFLEVVKLELERMNIWDINSVQCLILYNVGRGQVTIGEFTSHGYYLGSNVSYNLRKMLQNSYLLQEANPHDDRSSHVRLSEKGIKLYDKLDKLFIRQAKTLAQKGIDTGQLDGLLTCFEGFWQSLLTRPKEKQSA